LTICIVYYSKTGKTRRVVEYIGEGLRGRGISVRVIPVKPAREYFSRLLHLNPRILYEVLSGSPIEIIVEGFDPGECRALVIATPVWWGAASPPVYSFIDKYAGVYSGIVYCVTTADLRVDYAGRLRRELEAKGYRVADCISVVDPVKDRGVIDRLVEEVAGG